MNENEGPKICRKIIKLNDIYHLFVILTIASFHIGVWANIPEVTRGAVLPASIFKRSTVQIKICTTSVTADMENVKVGTYTDITVFNRARC